MKNKYSVTGNVVTMLVEKNSKTLKVLFDVSDLPRVKNYDSWHITDNGYCYTTVNGKRRIMHRLLLNVRSPRFVVNHIDGDRINNTRENLRKATRRQSSKNVTKTFDRKNNTSGYKGVSWHSKKCYYQSKIGVDNRTIWIGAFDTSLEAAKAYDEAARAYHGEFAYLNFARRDLLV